MNKSNVQMVDLVGQYKHIQEEIDTAILDTVGSGRFIAGPMVETFSENLKTYLGTSHVIPCGNGTDAIQIALMAIGIGPGDEVIAPSFTYAASAEAVALLGGTIRFVDVDEHTFNLTAGHIEASINERTRAVIAVDLYGQCAPLEEIRELCDHHNLVMIEDAAQAMGAIYEFSDGRRAHSGTIGHIGTTSFFPTKNLGCYGDGGAIFTDNTDLALLLRKIANHGQIAKYEFERIGINSRLDAVQAAVLDVKLKYLGQFVEARQKAAKRYDQYLNHISGVRIPFRADYSTHAYHQYTVTFDSLKVREKVKNDLRDNGIPSMIYYHIAVHEQEAYRHFPSDGDLKNSHNLSRKVLSLPMHTELTDDQQVRVVEVLKKSLANG